MPTALVAVGALVLTGVVAWTLLRLRRLDRDVKRLKRALEESAREEAASEQRIRELLGFREQRVVNGEHRKRERRRHLWLVPAVAALASVAGWLRQHPHQVVASTAAVASALAMALMVVSGAGGSERAQPPEPAPIIAPRTPSSVTPLPSSVSSPARPPSSTPGGGTQTTTAPRVSGTQGVLVPRMPGTTTTSVPPLPTTVTTVVPTTTTATKSKPGKPGCLLQVTLPPVADVCVG
jgi:hypothetical protein